MISEALANNLIGIIMMSVIGLSIGNYATSLVYRIPRNLKIANDPPYCECERRVYLEVRDNFPFFSWLINRRSCRFCGIPIPGLYAMVELACGVAFVAGFFVFGVGEELILALGIAVFLIVVAAMQYAEGRLYAQVVVIAVGFGAIRRTLLDDAVFPFIQSGYLAMMAALIVWGGMMLARRRKLPLPGFVIMMGVGGLILGARLLPALFIGSAVWGLIYALIWSRVDPRMRRSAATIGVTTAILLLLYWPALAGFLPKL